MDKKIRSTRREFKTALINSIREYETNKDVDMVTLLVLLEDLKVFEAEGVIRLNEDEQTELSSILDRSGVDVFDRPTMVLAELDGDYVDTVKTGTDKKLITNLNNIIYKKERAV